MPVTCLNTNTRKERLISFDYSRAQWDQLKVEYVELGLHMNDVTRSRVPDQALSRETGQRLAPGVSAVRWCDARPQG